MASAYAKLVVPLGLGIQTDVDEKLLPVGKVVRLENGVWQRSGEVIKRPGSISLGTQYAAGTPGSMPAPWQLATHKGALVSLSKAGPRPIGVYSSALAKWMAPAGSTAADNINGVISKLRGQVLHRRGTVFRSNSAGSSARVFAPDIATNGTYALIAWVQNNDVALSASVQAQIVELATGKTLFTFSTNTTYGQTGCRCVFVNGSFQLVWVSGANVNMVLWTVTNIAAGTGSSSGPFALATDALGSPPAIDVIASGTTTLVLYAGGASVMRIIKTTSGGGISIVNLTTSVGGAVNQGACSWMADLSGSGAIAAIVGSLAQGITVQWNVNAATGTPTASYTIDAVGTDIAYLCGHTISSAGTGEFVVLYYKNGGAGANRTLWGRRTVASGITNGVWIWSASIGSKTFIHNGEFYAVMAYESNTQGALFVVRVPTNLTDATDGNKTPSARMCTGSIGARDVYTPPSMYVLSTDVFLTTTKINTRLVQLGSTSFDTGVDTIRMTFNPTNVNSPREFADNLYVCGGILGAFDGITFAEEGFHLAPEAPTLTQQVGGSLTLLGNYIYQAVFRYTDEYGRLRRSSPSQASQIASLTGANQGIQVSIKTLKLSGHIGFSNGSPVSKVVIEIYRNLNTEDTLQLLAVVANNDAVDSVTYVDTQSDATLSAGEALYTNGGVLPFQPPPAALAVAVYKDRLAVIDADDPTLIRVSLPLVETEGPRFNDESGVRIDDARGDLVGHAAIDDRLIAFKADTVYTVPGDGPDADGNGTFGLAQIIANGIGCSEPRSIVQVPDGIMFRSSSTRSGIFLVNRGLAVEYIGAPVQSFLQSTGNVATSVVDAVHLPGLQRTKLYLSSGFALVYDHTTKLWSTDTGQASLAATAWQAPNAAEARPVYQINSGSMFCVIEDFTDATFDDTSSPVEMYIETPWISAADLKGFFRFKRIQLVGEKRIINDASDPGYTVQVSLYKDNATSPFYTASRTMLVTDDINDVEVRYSTQLSTLKVGVLVKLGAAGSNFAGPKLTALTIVYMVEEGLRKTAYTNRLT